MNEGDEARIQVTGKLFARVNGYEEALKRTTGSGLSAPAFYDAHLYNINLHVDSDRFHERLRNDLHVYHDDDDAHLTPADQQDPTFRSRLSRARKAPNTTSETTDSCRST